MIAFARRLWHDPVWSKVIAAGIIALAIVAGTYFLNLWNTIWTAAKAVIGFLGGSTPIWNWAIAVILICLAVAAIFIVAVIRAAMANPPEPTVNDYTFDIFYGAEWRWRYLYGKIIDLHCACPECKFQVFAHHGDTWGAASSLQCDQCGWRANVEGPPDGLDEKIRLLIQQKIRADTWRDAMRANAPKQAMRIDPPAEA